MKSKRTIMTLSLAVAALALTQSAVNAAVLNINWSGFVDAWWAGTTYDGAYSGQGFIADPGNSTWNNLTTLSSSSLVYSDGTPATGVSVSGGTGTLGLVNNTNYQLYTFAIHTATTITISGLVPNGEYELAVMAIRPDATGSLTDISAGGTTLTVGPWTGSSLDAQNWASFASVTADGSGTLTFTSAKNASSPDTWGYAYVDAFQLQAIPEPATWALAGIALAPLLFRRTRRGC